MSDASDQIPCPTCDRLLTVVGEDEDHLYTESCPMCDRPPVTDANPHKGDGVTYPAEVALQWKRERDEARAAARERRSPPVSDRRECRYGACSCCETLPEVRQKLAAAEARIAALEVEVAQTRESADGMVQMAMDKHREAQARIAALEAERDEAREVARMYAADAFGYMSEYLWEKHNARDIEDYPWLEHPTATEHYPWPKQRDEGTRELAALKGEESG